MSEEGAISIHSVQRSILPSIIRDDNIALFPDINSLTDGAVHLDAWLSCFFICHRSFVDEKRCIFACLYQSIHGDSITRIPVKIYLNTSKRVDYTATYTMPQPSVCLMINP